MKGLLKGGILRIRFRLGKRHFIIASMLLIFLFVFAPTVALAENKTQGISIAEVSEQSTSTLVDVENSSAVYEEKRQSILSNSKDNTQDTPSTSTDQTVSQTDQNGAQESSVTSSESESIAESVEGDASNEGSSSVSDTVVGQTDEEAKSAASQTEEETSSDETTTEGKESTDSRKLDMRLSVSLRLCEDTVRYGRCLSARATIPGSFRRQLYAFGQKALRPPA